MISEPPSVGSLRPEKISCLLDFQYQWETLSLLKRRFTKSRIRVKSVAPSGASFLSARAKDSVTQRHGRQTPHACTIAFQNEPHIVDDVCKSVPRYYGGRLDNRYKEQASIGCDESSRGRMPAPHGNSVGDRPPSILDTLLDSTKRMHSCPVWMKDSYQAGGRGWKRPRNACGMIKNIEERKKLELNHIG